MLSALIILLCAVCASEALEAPAEWRRTDPHELLRAESLVDPQDELSLHTEPVCVRTDEPQTARAPDTLLLPHTARLAHTEAGLKLTVTVPEVGSKVLKGDSELPEVG